jgi:hypothetical protein
VQPEKWLCGSMSYSTLFGNMSILAINFHPSAVASVNHTLICMWDYYYQAQRRYEAAYADWQQQAGRSES